MTESEIRKAIDLFLDAVRETDAYKRKGALLAALSSSSALSFLRQSEELQRKARKAPISDRKQILDEAKRLRLLYEEDPLVVNLRACNDELHDLLLPLLEWKIDL